ncbi:hypothetical protein AVEN_17651-1, partial [Araneus ventricosus]
MNPILKEKKWLIGFPQSAVQLMHYHLHELKIESFAGLRVLLQNPYNQELITHLGTRYEIVNPIQIRQEWGRRLSTRAATVNGTVTHLPQTSLFIETYEYKLYLDLELNQNLFPPTLVQFIYEKGGPPLALQE